MLRPFGINWWFWLLFTGLAISGAMSTKLAGALTMLVIGTLAGWDLLCQLVDESITVVSFVMKPSGFFY